MTRHNVKRLPVDTGRSGWEAISARTFPLRSLSDNISADWLIIGAGFAGLSAARRLTQLVPDERIVLVDATEIATGPSGRNSGFMIDVPHDLSSGEYSVAGEAETRLEISNNRYAISFAASAAEEYGMSVETFDPSGKINAAATERGIQLNRNYAQSLAKIGEKFAHLDEQQMQELTGSSYYKDGLYTPGAVLIQPADYVRDFAKGLLGKVDIFENSPVVDLNRRDNLWHAKAGQGSVSAPKVILAVNGHIQDFGYFKGRLMHVFTYASMSAGYRASEYGNNVSGRARWALLPADPMGATIRKITSSGISRIVTRSRFTYDPSIEVSPQRVKRIAREHRRSFEARFPELKNVPTEYSWAGRLCLSRNHVAAFGEVEEGLFSACCENGLGTVKSTFAGVMAADLATKTSSERLSVYAKQGIPNRIPPEPISWIGANAVIRWAEYRAGNES